MVKNPEDRTDAVRQPVMALGGKLLELWYTLGVGQTGFFIAEFPDETAAAAMEALVGASGLVSTFDFTQVLSVNEWVSALQKAHKIG